MTDPRIDLEIEEREDAEGTAARIAYVTVHNERRLNTLGLSLIGELRVRFEELADDAVLRAIVLSGGGASAFIGGADVRELRDLTPQSARSFITALHEACGAIRDLDVPVIAKIRGYCLGAGLEIAASCDLRVAAEDARFGMPEVRVGIPSVIEAALLPRLIGWGKTAELVYTGEMIGAEEAHAAGLIERTAPAEALDRAAEDWVSAILAAGPHAIRAQKRLMREWERLPLGDAIAAGIEAFAASHQGTEPARYAERFLNRPRA